MSVMTEDRRAERLMAEREEAKVDQWYDEQDRLRAGPEDNPADDEEPDEEDWGDEDTDDDDWEDEEEDEDDGEGDY
jgi:hypothetical protein